MCAQGPIVESGSKKGAVAPGQSARARLPTERMDKAVKTDKRFILDADTDGCMRDNQIPAQSMA